MNKPIIQQPNGQDNLFTKNSSMLIDIELRPKPRQRIPMPKSMSMIQYWVDTGNHPYNENFNDENNSNLGSSLVEENQKFKEVLKSGNFINLNLERQSEITEVSEKKYFRPLSSSSSSVDTAAYILANNNTTKKAETLAIVEGSKTTYKGPLNYNSSNVVGNIVEVDKIDFIEKDTKSSLDEKAEHSILHDSEIMFEVDESFEKKCDYVPHRKLYNSSENPAEFTPVSEDNFNYQFQTPKKLIKMCDHPALATPKLFSRLSYHVKHRQRYKKKRNQLQNFNSKVIQENQNIKINNKNDLILSTPKTTKICNTNQIQDISQFKFNNFKLKSPRVLLHKLPYVYEQSKSSTSSIEEKELSNCNKILSNKEGKSPVKHSMFNYVKSVKSQELICDSRSVKSTSLLFNSKDNFSLIDELFQVASQTKRFSSQTTFKKSQLCLKESEISQKENKDIHSFSEKSINLNKKQEADKIAPQEFSKYTVVFSSDESEVLLTEDSVVKKNLNRKKRSKVTVLSKTGYKKQSVSQIYLKKKDHKPSELTENQTSNSLIKTDSSSKTHLSQTMTDKSKNMELFKTISKSVNEPLKHSIIILNNEKISTKCNTQIAQTNANGTNYELSHNHKFSPESNTISPEKSIQPQENISELKDRSLFNLSKLNNSLCDRTIKNKTKDQILQNESLEEDCILPLKSKSTNSSEHNNFSNDLLKQYSSNSFIIQKHLIHSKRKMAEQLPKFSNETKKGNSFKNVNNQNFLTKKGKIKLSLNCIDSNKISKMESSKNKTKENKLFHTKSKRIKLRSVSSDEECIIPMKINSNVNSSYFNKY